MTTWPENKVAWFHQDGFLPAVGLVGQESLGKLEAVFLTKAIGPGTRNGLEDDFVRSLAEGILAEAAAQLLGESSVAVRAILFTKSQGANWLVPWHQDLTLAAPDRIDFPGATAWTQKEGVWHVQPPAAILEKMVALRLHVDPCEPEDGPLMVVPGSHKMGRMSGDEIDALVASAPKITLSASPGDVIAICPLTLHASSKATGTSRRRVLHIEFCAESAFPF